MVFEQNAGSPACSLKLNLKDGVMDSPRQGTNERFEKVLARTETARGAVGRWKRRLRGALDQLPPSDRIAEEASRQELVATTLLAEMHRIVRGAKTAILPDYSGDGSGSMEIPLDPALTVREQAERLLKTARKGRRQAKILPQRRKALEGEYAEAEEFEICLGGEIEDSKAMKQRELLLDRLETRLLPRGLWPAPVRKREEPAPSKPVRWTLEGGWILMAGRSGTENDFLTTRIAKPDDLWFHVANVPGAHVLLRSPDGKPMVAPPELVERAASLAAWLSRMRAQAQVEVRFTERRRVRKPRKVPAGTVVMEQSRSILIKPAPPPES